MKKLISIFIVLIFPIGVYSFMPMLDPDEFISNIAKRMDESTVKIIASTEKGEGLSAGFFIRPDGTLITCNHSLGNGIDFIVLTKENKMYVSTIVTRNVEYDIAILKINPSHALTYLELDTSKNIKVGKLVFSIGHPNRIGYTFTQGMVSKINLKYYMLDINITHGNSGGAVVGLNGKVIGIVSRLYSDDKGFSLGLIVKTEYIMELLK